MFFISMLQGKHLLNRFIYKGLFTNKMYKENKMKQLPLSIITVLATVAITVPVVAIATPAITSRNLTDDKAIQASNIVADDNSVEKQADAVVAENTQSSTTDITTPDAALLETPVVPDAPQQTIPTPTPTPAPAPVPTPIPAPAHNQTCVNFVDANGDGRCDHCVDTQHGHGNGFIDHNGDGVCDYYDVHYYDGAHHNGVKPSTNNSQSSAAPVPKSTNNHRNAEQHNSKHDGGQHH